MDGDDKPFRYHQTSQFKCRAMKCRATKFNGTSPKGSYSARTGVNCPIYECKQSPLEKNRHLPTFNVFIIVRFAFSWLKIWKVFTNTIRKNLIGEVKCNVSCLFSQVADLAVAPLTITSERQEFVDFTKPYLDIGLDALLPKETRQRSLFSFLEIFDLSTWLVLLACCYICGCAVSICSFLSPFGYSGRFTQRRPRDEHKYRDRKNELSFQNGVWFAWSSLFNQVRGISRYTTYLLQTARHKIDLSNKSKEEWRHLFTCLLNL